MAIYFAGDPAEQRRTSPDQNRQLFEQCHDQRGARDDQGTLMARPSISSGRLPLVAAATIITVVEIS